MRYTISHHWDDPTIPQALLAPIDIAKIVAVYKDYNDEQVTIDSLFNSKKTEWQKVNPST
jgi:Skp family chaperone for outer membrane proteins